MDTPSSGKVTVNEMDKRVLVTPSFVDGKVKRIVERGDGTRVVQAWRWRQWNDTDSDDDSLMRVQRGLDVPVRVLRILGVPPGDWPSEAWPKPHLSIVESALMLLLLESPGWTAEALAVIGR